MVLIYQPSKRIFCGWFEPLKSTTYSEYPKYPSLISRLGVLNGRTGPSFLMFLFELRGDVVISEFSDMGKVRVGYRTSKITTTRGTIHWWDLLSKEYVKYDFTHSGDWKQQADAAIEELTHERVPR